MKPRVHNRHANTAPPGAIYCGRGTSWGNPFEIGKHGTRAQVIERFRCEVLPKLDLRPLRGKHLVCSCTPKECHCDWLLIKANETPLIITATGHRPNKLGGYGKDVRAKTWKVAHNYLGLSLATEVVSGMALGWDIAFAEAAFGLGIPFVAAVSFEGQESKWPEESRVHYHKVLKKAKRVVIVSPGGYSAFKMQERNAWMVDYSSRICALWNGSPGGTSNCIEYAEAMLRPIDNVWRDFAS
jgi:uncharacterized phage-like protein YoqJ